MKKLMVALIIFWGFVGITSQVYAEELDESDLYKTYLSDIDWEEATHGDDQRYNKEVQKNHPFTRGNEDEVPPPITLEMENGEVEKFEKGIGTVASNPSTITYDVEEVKIEKFKSYIGIDASVKRPAKEGYGEVEKVEIEADEKVIYTTLDEYPEGITTNTPAIKVDVKIPENTKRISLKAYSGKQTWADEIVYAGAYFLSKSQFKDKKDNSAEELPEKRRKISNENPLLMMPLYAHGPEYEKGNYKFWGDDTLVGKWESISDDIKPYTAIQLHPDDLPKNSKSAKDFYEHYLEEAANYVNPKTGKNEPIPLILTVYTAGNESRYTAAHWLDMDWIDNMYKKYSNLHGIFSTENYWIWTNSVEKNAAEYLRLSAKYGGYFIWSEQNEHGSIEKIFGGHNRPDQFKKAVEKYHDNFVFMFKNTPAGSGTDAASHSYMSGLWLTDYAGQWGGLMDTWKWYETGKWKLFAESNIGKTQGNRQWLTHPEGMLAQEALPIYLNGGSVYNFEHPQYTYSVNNQSTPLFKEVIEPFFRYIIANPAPSKEQMLAKTKSVLYGNLSNYGQGQYYEGLNVDKAQTPLYTTGQFGNIPAVPSSIKREHLESKLSKYNIELTDINDNRLKDLESKKAYFNELYPEIYEGNIFAQKLKNRWFIYNYSYNKNEKQSGIFKFDNYKLEVNIEPHTSIMAEELENKLNIKLSNFRTDKSELWEAATNAEEAKNLPEFSKQQAIDWVKENYIKDTPYGVHRQSIFVVRNVNKKPSIKVNNGRDNSYEAPEIEYDEEQRQAIIKINNNGYLDFDIVY